MNIPRAVFGMYTSSYVYGVIQHCDLPATSLHRYIKLRRSLDCFLTSSFALWVSLVHFRHPIMLLRYADKRIVNKESVHRKEQLATRINTIP